MATVGADFVWRMEDVLDLYAEAYDPRRPWVCFDEKPYQLRSDVRASLPPAPGQPRRIDYEYKSITSTRGRARATSSSCWTRTGPGDAWK
jgi:hypothetical protein